MYLQLEDKDLNLQIISLLNKNVLDIRYKENRYTIDVAEITAIAYVPKMKSIERDQTTLEACERISGSISILFQNDSLIIEVFYEEEATPNNINKKNVLLNSYNKIMQIWINFKQQLMPNFTGKFEEA